MPLIPGKSKTKEVKIGVYSYEVKIPCGLRLYYNLQTKDDDTLGYEIDQDGYYDAIKIYTKLIDLALELQNDFKLIPQIARIPSKPTPNSVSELSSSKIGPGCCTTY